MVDQGAAIMPEKKQSRLIGARPISSWVPFSPSKSKSISRSGGNLDVKGLASTISAPLPYRPPTPLFKLDLSRNVIDVKRQKERREGATRKAAGGAPLFEGDLTFFGEGEFDAVQSIGSRVEGDDSDEEEARQLLATLDSEDQDSELDLVPTTPSSSAPQPTLEMLHLPSLSPLFPISRASPSSSECSSTSAISSIESEKSDYNRDCSISTSRTTPMYAKRRGGHYGDPTGLSSGQQQTFTTLGSPVSSAFSPPHVRPLAGPSNSTGHARPSSVTSPPTFSFPLLPPSVSTLDRKLDYNYFQRSVSPANPIVDIDEGLSSDSGAEEQEDGTQRQEEVVEVPEQVDEGVWASTRALILRSGVETTIEDVAIVPAIEDADIDSTSLVAAMLGLDDDEDLNEDEDDRAVARSDSGSASDGLSFALSSIDVDSVDLDIPLRASRSRTTVAPSSPPITPTSSNGSQYCAKVVYRSRSYQQFTKLQPSPPPPLPSRFDSPYKFDVLPDDPLDPFALRRSCEEDEATRAEVAREGQGIYAAEAARTWDEIEAQGKENMNEQHLYLVRSRTSSKRSAGTDEGEVTSPPSIKFDLWSIPKQIKRRASEVALRGSSSNMKAKSKLSVEAIVGQEDSKGEKKGRASGEMGFGKKLRGIFTFKSSKKIEKT